jgi:hypothetical protein
MVNMENYEEYLLLYADGELSAAELKELEVFISQHPELKDEMDIYAATKLVPDEAMVYTGKEQLLKIAPRTIALQSWWVYGAAAACIGILLMVGLNRQDSTEPTNIARTIPVEEKRIDTAVSEELHSIPASPVAVETTKPAQPVYLAKEKSKKQKAKVIPTPVKEPIIVKQEIPVKQEPVVPPVVKTPKTQTAPAPQHVAVAEKEKESTIPSSPIETNEDKKGLLAMLPKKEDMHGVTALSKNVTEKIEKIKDIPGKIRDTDVHFKIGKKELFVVRL